MDELVVKQRNFSCEFYLTINKTTNTQRLQKKIAIAQQVQCYNYQHHKCYNYFAITIARFKSHTRVLFKLAVTVKVLKLIQIGLSFRTTFKKLDKKTNKQKNSYRSFDVFRNLLQSQQACHNYNSQVFSCDPTASCSSVKDRHQISLFMLTEFQRSPYFLSHLK